MAKKGNGAGDSSAAPRPTKVGQVNTPAAGTSTNAMSQTFASIASAKPIKGSGLAYATGHTRGKHS